MNILQNNGEIAGQSVFHLHESYVIPRYSKDDAIIKWTPGTQDVDVYILPAEKVQKIL
ncbi:MAG: HIT family protein [Eubacterium sp.]